MRPVVAKDADSADVYIPDDELYYDYFTYDLLPTHRHRNLTVLAPLHKIPLLMRGGHIFPRRDRPRRSSAPDALGRLQPSSSPCPAPAAAPRAPCTSTTATRSTTSRASTSTAASCWTARPSRRPTPTAATPAP